MARSRRHRHRHPAEHRVTCMCCKRRFNPYDDPTPIEMEDIGFPASWGSLCVKCCELLSPRLAKASEQVLEDVRKLRQLERLVVA